MSSNVVQLIQTVITNTATRKIGKVMSALKQVYPNAQAGNFYYAVDVMITGVGTNDLLYDIPFKDINNMRQAASVGDIVTLEQNFQGKWEIVGVTTMIVDSGTIRYFTKGSFISSTPAGFTSRLPTWTEFVWASDGWNQAYIFDRFGNRVR